MRYPRTTKELIKVIQRKFSRFAIFLQKSDNMEKRVISANSSAFHLFYTIVKNLDPNFSKAQTKAVNFYYHNGLSGTMHVRLSSSQL